MKISEAIDNIFSHNEEIGIWFELKNCGQTFHELEWQGMAHEIPDKFLSMENWTIFGTIPDKMLDAARINILIKMEEWMPEHWWVPMSF